MLPSDIGRAGSRELMDRAGGFFAGGLPMVGNGAPAATVPDVVDVRF
jgi:hypothetical protein